MKIYHKLIDRERNILQVTTTDERVYIKDNDFSNPYDSVTWILSYYPKGPWFYKWVASVGSEAEVIKEIAGARGRKIHHAIEAYLNGHTIECNMAIPAELGGDPEELTVEEYSALIAFHNWYKSLDQPFKLLASEETVWNEELKYAGTADIRCMIGENTWTIDLKTGAEREEHELQLTFYQHTPGREQDKLGLLYLGEKVKNQKHYKFKEVAGDWNSCLAVYQIFKRENPQTKLNQYLYPASISIETEAIKKPKREKEDKDASSQ